MIKASIPIMVEDPLIAADCHFKSDHVFTDEERFFLDGPVSARVAVVDREPTSGQLTPLVPVVPRTRPLRYATQPDGSPGQIALSAFGTVLETLQTFERPDVLGHRLAWAFGSPQLLVVPRAGIWKNAFYDRYARALEFFSFDHDGARVHTALSRDIVAHETGHAVLDALAPALYDALTPETLGLHEAIGDLTAMVMALQSRQIRNWLVAKGQATLAGDTVVSQLAQQFGAAMYGRPLRDLNNEATMTSVGSTEPHELACVLGGAIWAAMVHNHQFAVASARAESAADQSDESVQGRALGISARRIARILFRALDYLPPAEASFADYARAVLRSDSVAVPNDRSGYREVLAQEFVKRGIVDDAGALDPGPALAPVTVDLPTVLESDWAAYAFVEANRSLFGLPDPRDPAQPSVPFRLFPRRLARRTAKNRDGQPIERSEAIIQVTWEQSEPNDVGDLGRLLVADRAVFHGTTLVLGGEPDANGQHPVLSCLTTDGDGRHAAARDAHLRLLVERGQLDIASSWEAFMRRPFAPLVFARVSGDTLRLRGVARLLHLAGDDR